LWWNWQTRKVESLVLERGWGFKSLQPHQFMSTELNNVTWKNGVEFRRVVEQVENAEWERFYEQAEQEKYDWFREVADRLEARQKV
jgi:hypothetical protein